VTGYSEPSLVFLLGTATELTDGDRAAQAIVQGRPAVVEAREDAVFREALADAGLTPRPVAVNEGQNHSDGDDARLTIYRGEPQTEMEPEMEPDTQPQLPSKPKDRP
jgi:hypothetical protein